MPTLARTRINHVPNPSAETNLDKYVVVSSRGTIERSTEQAKFGTHSVKFTNTAFTGSGQTVNYQFVEPWAEADTVSAGLWVYVPSGGAVTHFYFAVDSYSSTEFLGALGTTSIAIDASTADQWVRLVLENLTPLAETTRLRLRTQLTATDVGDIYFIDGLEAVVGATLPAYFDGDSPRYVEDGTRYSIVHSWEGTPHASKSIQEAYEREQVRTYPVVTKRGWRYFATHLNGDGTETLLDVDLPLSGVEIEDVLSGDQAMNFTIEPSYSRLRGPNGRPLFHEYGTAVYAENDGDIRYGGILVNSSIEGHTWQLETNGFTSYLRDLPYTGSGYKGIRVDPIDVLRVIWNHAQSQPGGNIGLEIAGTTTGGKVKIGTELQQVEFNTQSGPVSFESGPYKLNWYTNHDLARDIDDLAMDTPFDYHERHFWDGDTIRHRLDIGYPRLGKRRTDLRFVYGVNVFEAPSLQRDGSLYASGTMVLGAGEGASMKMSLVEPPTRPYNRLRRIAIVQDDTIKSKKRATSRAQTENQWRRQAIDDITSIIVQDHKHARLGSVSVGDEIRIEGRGDWQDWDTWVRVLAIAYEPDNNNVAEYTIARTDKLTS